MKCGRCNVLWERTPKNRLDEPVVLDQIFTVYTCSCLLDPWNKFYILEFNSKLEISLERSEASESG